MSTTPWIDVWRFVVSFEMIGQESVDFVELVAALHKPKTRRPPMLKHFDHVTVAVRDLGAAKTFFAALGFEVDKEVVVMG